MTQSLPLADVAISPSVLFGIGEIYQRRSDLSTSRVVGALFGQVQTEEGTLAEGKVKINVRHCFAVPHSEVGDQISINSEYYKIRNELHRKCYGKDSVIVGWFSIAEEEAVVSEKNTDFINESFGREVLASSASAFNVHLAMSIGASGVKKSVRITDMTNKQQLNGPAQISCSSNDSFALKSALSGLSSEEGVIAIPSEKSFLEAQLRELESQIAILKESKSASEQLEQLSKMHAGQSSSSSSVNQDLEGLMSVSNMIRSQLENINELLMFNVNA